MSKGFDGVTRLIIDPESLEKARRAEKRVVVMDSSQLSTYGECPMMWNYAYKESISKIEAPPNDPMVMGTFGHKLLERYYSYISKGHSQSAAIEYALAFVPEAEVTMCQCGLSKDEHISETMGLFTGCSFTPQPFPLDQEKRKLVKDRFTIHCYTYSKGDIVPTTDAVEVGFSHKLYEDDYYLFVLEGKIDVIGTFSGQPAIMDHKFQMRRRDIYKKSLQFRNYSLVADMPLLIVNYIRLTQKMDKDTLNREISTFSTFEREWWRGEVIKLFKRIADEQHLAPRQEWESCSGKFGYTCQYVNLCEEFVPELKQGVKSALYHPKEVWRPW